MPVVKRTRLMLNGAQAGQVKRCSTMGWEQRGGRSYYYRKEREGSRVRSVYVGGSGTAAFISQLEKGRREEDETKREDRQRELAKLERQDATIEAACRLIDTVTEAAF